MWWDPRSRHAIIFTTTSKSTAELPCWPYPSPVSICNQNRTRVNCLLGNILWDEITAWCERKFESAMKYLHIKAIVMVKVRLPPYHALEQNFGFTESRLKWHETLLLLDRLCGPLCSICMRLHPWQRCTHRAPSSYRDKNSRFSSLTYPAEQSRESYQSQWRLHLRLIRSILLIHPGGRLRTSTSSLTPWRFHDGIR